MSRARTLHSCSNRGFSSILQGFPRTPYVSYIVTFFLLFKCAFSSCSTVTFFFLSKCHVKTNILSNFLTQICGQITYFTSLYKLKSNLHVHLANLNSPQIFYAQKEINERKIMILKKKKKGQNNLYTFILKKLQFSLKFNPTNRKCHMRWSKLQTPKVMSEKFQKEDTKFGFFFYLARDILQEKMSFS